MAEINQLKIDFPGLIEERLPSGRSRLRVRVEGNKRKRIKLHIAPDHKDFKEHYLAARAGVEMKPPKEKENTLIKGSISWLTRKHEKHLEDMVEAGLTSALTLKKRKGLYERLRARCGDFEVDMPTSEVYEIRDELASTPATADSMVEAIRVMYRWAKKRNLVDENPALGVEKIDPGNGGAIPWTVEDLKQYREAHPPGTTPHLVLTLFMFTACRISDAVLLGRANEFVRDGVRGIGWQPGKKGSAYVEIPMLPPFYKATRASNVQGSTYLLTKQGQPYASGDALGQHFRGWIKEAGLVDQNGRASRSSHGIRKAAGNLLALEGCSQYEIMSIHGHTEAKTSEIYTKGVERWRLAAKAMRRLEAMEW